VTKADVGAVVLCGGGSRRMGRDKGSLPFGAETLLERVLRSVTAVTSEVVVAAAAQMTPARYPVSRDAAPGAGPLPALLDAVAMLKTELVFVVACDTPLLESGLVPMLADLCQGFDGAVPTINGRRAPTCAVYQTTALLRARTQFGDPRNRSLHEYLSLLNIRDVTVAELSRADPDLRSFVGCNTPEEYHAALRMAGLEVNSE
jgi:molybdenum cofactor guanylyltransferase